MKHSSVKVDIVIIGAGMAGIMAGLAAAKQGASVMIVEMTYTPGGQATSTLLSEMSGFTFRREKIYGGIEDELIEHLIHVGSAKHYFNMLLSPQSTERVDRLRYNPEILKVLLDWFVLDSKIMALGGCRLHSVEEQRNSIHVTVGGGLHTTEITASILIDASGDAEATLRAGFDTYRSEEEREVATLLFRLSNVDLDQYEAFASGGNIKDVIEKGYNLQVVPDKYLSIAPIPGTKDVSVNATRALVDYDSPADITRGIVEARIQILKIIPFMKSTIPGLQSAALAAMGSVMGMRDGRRIVASTEVTTDDILSGRHYFDSVALGCYPMGAHDPNKEEIEWIDTGGIYYIPYSAMIPLNSKRIIATGKCICCDRMASTSIRCIPVVMNTGEVSGYAAAMALQKNISPAEINAKELRELLAEKGLNLG